MSSDLSRGEIELLIDGLSDDVAFVWVLIHFGIRGNPPADDRPPSPSEVEAAFSALHRLSHAGLVKVGHMEYLDGGPPGRVAPVKHVEEPLAEVRRRVLGACGTGSDWEWSCWVVNTELGNEVARLPPPLGQIAVGDPRVGRAVALWTGFGFSPYPRADEQRVVDAFGEEALDLLPLVHRLVDAFDSTEALHHARDLDDALEQATSDFRARYPDVAEDVVHALAWRFSYNNR